ASAFRRLHGGTEAYLQNLIPALVTRGHEILFCAGREGDRSRSALELPSGMSACCADELGPEATLARARDFRPQLIFCHRLDDLELERRLLALCPGVFFAHNYYGTCISGAKTRSFPRPTPCERV